MRDFLDILAVAAYLDGADPVVAAVLRDFAQDMVRTPAPVVDEVRTIGGHGGSRGPRRDPYRHA